MSGYPKRKYSKREPGRGRVKDDPLYTLWKNMRNRCNNPSNQDYQYYGGRGVSICPRWGNFWNFVDDMGPRPDGHSIDRLDTNAGYTPGNCRWATATVQSRNRRARRCNKTGIKGVTRTASGRWHAALRTSEKNLYLGLFDNIFDAAAARKSAELKHWGTTYA